MKRAKWMFVALVLVFLAPGCAQMERTQTHSASPVMDRVMARRELRVGGSGDMPPMNLSTKEGTVVGLNVDVAQMIEDAMGVRLSLQRLDFAGLLPALEFDRIDMIVSYMTMTPDRNLKAAFVSPYFISGKAFLIKRSSIAQAKGLPDVNNPQSLFAALKGSTSEAVIRKGAPQAKLLTAATQTEAIQMVIDGKVDAIDRRLPYLHGGGLQSPGRRPYFGDPPDHV